MTKFGAVFAAALFATILPAKAQSPSGDFSQGFADGYLDEVLESQKTSETIIQLRDVAKLMTSVYGPEFDYRPAGAHWEEMQADLGSHIAVNRFGGDINVGYAGDKGDLLVIQLTEIPFAPCVFLAAMDLGNMNPGVLVDMVDVPPDEEETKKHCKERSTITWLLR